MNQSLQLRKKIAADRARDRKLFLQGKLRKEEVCLAISLGPEACRGPLILDRVQVPADEEDDEPGASKKITLPSAAC
jgi:hypothetical protein